MDKPSVRKNYIYRLFYEILSLITPFITAPYVARVLGADGVGIYSYTSSIVTYFMLFAELGTASYGEREIAQHRDDRAAASKLFWEIELITVFTTAACVVVWFGFISFQQDYRYYYLALLPMLLSTMFDISWFFTGYEQVKYIVLRNTLCKLAGIVLLFILVREKDDLIIYMLINSGVQLLGNISMWTYLPKMLCRVDPKTFRFRHHFHETLIYFIPTIATSIYTVLDKTLIGVITNDSFENGYYEQASKVVNMGKSIVFGALNTVMGARISYLFAEGRIKEIHERIERSMNFIMMLGYGVVFGIIGIAETFVPLFFGEGYEPVVNLLYVMAPIILIIGVSNCLGNQYFVPIGQRVRSAKVIILGSVVNFCLNLILIPHFKAMGATFASLVAELIISILFVKLCDGYITGRMLVNYSLKRLPAGAIMCIAVYMIGRLLSANLLVCIVIQVLVGIAIYGGCLLLVKDDMVHYLINGAKDYLARKRNEK